MTLITGVGALVQVAQRANDLDTAVAFYRDMLGARVLGRFDPPGLAFLALGGVRLLLEKDAPSATLYFHVDDLQSAYQALHAAGVTLEGEPHMIFFDADGQFGAPGEEEWMTFLRDPSGNLVGLVQRKAR
jgi:methylmalonyl-CoA/ethylmalonyl-CoA epimerase